MEIIPQENLEEIMTTLFNEKQKLIVSGPPGFLGPHFDTSRNSFVKDRTRNILGGFNVMNRIKENKNEDKMEIEALRFANFSNDIKKQFNFRKEGYQNVSHEDDWYQRWLLRVALITGFAYCGIMANSRFAGFLKNQQLTNRKFWVKHDTIYPLLKERMMFTGDTEKDFEQAFKLLWFHFPQDLTGRDSDIKAVTLQLGLMEAKFE